MKIFTLLLFFLSGTIVSATTYYISPNGNDSNSGTITSPFFTLNKAWSVIKAGDIIYARGGTYRYSSRQTLKGKNGTSSDTIKIYAYPGERPVFTKSSNYSTPNWPNGLIYLVGNYTHWKNIEISYYKQATTAIWFGMAVFGSSHNKFERINSHHNGHGMIIRDESNHNLVLNCDFHHNADPLTTTGAYGNGDGLEVGYMSGSTENIIKGCRFWNNSDDGIDLWSNNGNVIIDGCWAWANGYREDGKTPGGDGGGFKFGSTTTATGTQFKRTVKNSMSVYNRRIGFNQNGANVKFNFLNNIAYKNPEGIVFYAYNLPHVIKNNVSFGNSSDWKGSFSNAIMDHNSYSSIQSSGPVVSASAFITVDTTGISGPRRSDGSLPVINFLRPAPGSALINAGINVGIPYSGSAPDLGAFETQMTSSTSVVTYLSSKIDAAAPGTISVSYNSALANIMPSNSSYTVMVNSVTRPVSKMAISGKDVILTLESQVAKGDIVTIAYTKPSVNPLQCLGATQAATISAKTVTNGVGANPGTIVPDISQSKISFYPNPAREYVNIKNSEPTEGQIIRIVDLSGKLCLEQSLLNDALIRLPINLKKGIYIVEIVSGKIKNHIQKLVVE